MYKVGDRVGAIQDKVDGIVYLYGYGVFVGEEVPPSGPLHEGNIPNPKIVLDNGVVVWGYQCWWGVEEKVRNWMMGRTFSMVVPD